MIQEPEPIPHWPGRLVDLGDQKVYVRSAPGADDAEQALCVHGLEGSSRNWTDLMDLLRSRLACDALDLRGRREMQHLDPVRGHQRQVGQVLVGQHHHVAGGQLVALGDVGVGDLFPVEGAEAAELDPGPVLAVHLAEGYVTLLRRGV